MNLMVIQLNMSFSNPKDLFDIVLATHHNISIALKIITKNVSLPIFNKIISNQCNKEK